MMIRTDLQGNRSWLFPLYVIVVAILYICLGHLLVRLLYQVGFIEFVNELLGYQLKHIDRYYAFAGTLIISFLSFVSMIGTFFYIIYSNKQVHFVWLVVVFLNRRYLVTHLHRAPMIIVSTLIAAMTCCYLFVHLTDHAECKYFLLAASTPVILGGAFVS